MKFELLQTPSYDLVPLAPNARIESGIFGSEVKRHSLVSEKP